MKFKITENNNLKIICDDNDKEMLENIKVRCCNDDVSFLAELLEETGWQPNGQLIQINPEDVGALTDSPILSDDVTFDDDGKVTVRGNVWWFPNYMVENFAETLINKGAVIFKCAEENTEDNNKSKKIKPH
ncbi:hypothetical protein GW796_06460 [archaeon]|nr:hypothetical protein [archaeon]